MMSVTSHDQTITSVTSHDQTITSVTSHNRILQWHHGLGLVSSSPAPCGVGHLSLLVSHEPAHCPVAAEDFSVVSPEMSAPDKLRWILRSLIYVRH